jgi:hypothetical protein
MATASVTNILRIPGRLFLGGSAAGIVRDSEIRLDMRFKDITAEEFGGSVWDQIYLGQAAIFAAVMRDFDSTMVSNVFSDSSGAYTVTSTRPGTRFNTKAVSLTLVPRYSGHPTVTLHNAVPRFGESAAMQFSLTEETGLAVAFVGLPNASGQVYSIA